MKFNPGDNVSFINEKQDGVVVKTLSNGKVIVAIEDGFEIEVFEKELVLTGKPKSKNETKVPNPVEESPIIENLNLIQLCETGSIVLVAVPAVLGAVLTGKIQYAIVNNCGYKLHFTFFSKRNKKWLGIAEGSIETGNSELVLEIKREDLVDISSFLIQGLIFSNGEIPGIGYFKKESGVLLPDLRSANQNISGVASYAKIVNLYSETRIEEIQIKDLFEQYQQEDIKSKKENLSVKKQEINYSAQGIVLNEKEVDLHIEMLRKEINGLSNSDMIQIQLNHFHSEMDQAIRQHFKRIVFIHGVGNGKLKQSIRDELRQYPGIAFRDAEQSRYGYGATEVIFM